MPIHMFIKIMLITMITTQPRTETMFIPRLLTILTALLAHIQIITN